MRFFWTNRTSGAARNLRMVARYRRSRFHRQTGARFTNCPLHAPKARHRHRSVACLARESLERLSVGIGGGCLRLARERFDWPCGSSSSVAWGVPSTRSDDHKSRRAQYTRNLQSGCFIRGLECVEDRIGPSLWSSRRIHLDQASPLLPHARTQYQARRRDALGRSSSRARR